MIHGDFHFANVLIRPDEPRPGGDRRLGAGHDRRPAARPRPPARHLAGAGRRRGGHRRSSPGGFPTADEIVARYAGGSDRDLSACRWFRGARLLPARPHPGGHPRPRLRRQGPEGDRRPPARPHAHALRPGDGAHRGPERRPQSVDAWPSSSTTRAERPQQPGRGHVRHGAGTCQSGRRPRRCASMRPWGMRTDAGGPPRRVSGRSRSCADRVVARGTVVRRRPAQFAWPASARGTGRRRRRSIDDRPAARPGRTRLARRCR